MAKDKNDVAISGKPWKTDSSHDNFNDADTRRHKLLETAGLQVKVRRAADDTFNVRVRAIKTAENVKSKKKRSKRKNTK